MNLRPLLFAFVLANWSGWPIPSMAADRQSCPVTRPPDPPFTPPAPYSSNVGSDEFLYGGPSLWTVVYPDWHIHSGGKLPFFRQGWKTGERPRLTVVARRLDGEGPLVWSGLAGSGFMEGKGLAGMFMTTGIDIPSSGCWEIGARYVDASRDGSYSRLSRLYGLGGTLVCVLSPAAAEVRCVKVDRASPVSVLFSKYEVSLAVVSTPSRGTASVASPVAVFRSEQSQNGAALSSQPDR